MKPFTRNRLTADGSREWSRPVEAWAATETPRRLYVLAESGIVEGCVSVGEMPVTSHAVSAESAGAGDEVTMNLAEARWLLAILPVAIADAEERLRAARGDVDVG